MPEMIPEQEDIQTRRRRLLYRACHRGTKELDLILGEFAKHHLSGFNTDMLSRFELLLSHEEMILQAWLMGHVQLPPEADRELLQTIIYFQRQHARAAGKDAASFAT